MKDVAAGGQDTLLRVLDFALKVTPGAIPDAVMKRAALLLLDTLGIAAAAAPMEAGRIGRETALTLFSAGDPELSARMLFDGRSASLAGAVFAAATQIDNLDGHDGFNLTKGHIGIVVIPTLCALAEKHDLSGPEALTTIVIGYEIAARAGIALHATASDYHTSGAWNALGVTAMVSRLRGLSPNQLREALGIAEFYGPRSQMMREIAAPTMLHDGSSWGALAGVSAALMAARGFTGAPAVTIEAPGVANYWADLGQEWMLPRQYIKPYPTCRWAHASIDAVRELQHAHGFAADEIAGVHLATFNEGAALFQGVPETTSKAQYAISFPVAAMLVHGRIGLEQISGGGLCDPAVAAMVPRVKVSTDPRFVARFPAERWAQATVTLKNGAVLSSSEVQGRGEASRPFGTGEIVEKYHEFADPALGAARAQALCDACLALTNLESRFADVTRHLYRAGR